MRGHNPYIAYGNAARDRRSFAAAAVFYEEAVRIDPRHAAIHIQCGHMHKEAGNLAAAGRHYALARQLTPEDPDLFLQLGHFHKVQNSLEDAAAAYSRAMILAPDWAEPQRELTYVAERLAAKDATNAAARGPGSSTTVLPVADGRLSLRLNDGRIQLLEVDLGGAVQTSIPPARATLPDPVQQASPSPVQPAPPFPVQPTSLSAVPGHFDGIAGTTAMGWAIDLDHPADPPEVEFLIEGKVVATAIADLQRDDVAQLGFGDGRNGFRCKLPFSQFDHAGIAVHARYKRSGTELPGSPRRPQTFRAVEKWRTRRNRLSKRSERRLRERLNRETSGQTLSIVMPVYNTRHDWLRCMLDSIRGQWCGNWELICVDDCSTDPAILPLLHEYAGRDARIHIVGLPTNAGIAHATNAGIRAASSEYVAFVDHDDYLEPDAVFKLLRASRTGAELIYSDEILTGGDIGDVTLVAARPAFSYDFYLSHPYFVHVVCVQRRLALAIGGWNEDLHISGDVDFVLRIIERATTVAHVPAILYRWRTHAGSAGHNSKADVTAAMHDILAAHLQRIGITAAVRDGMDFNQYRIDFPDHPGKTLVVIPTKNRVDLLRTCVESIRRTVPAASVRIVIIDHASDDPQTMRYLKSLQDDCEVMPYQGTFNYSAMNNAAVARHGEGCDFILFANNDIEAIEPGWLESMRSLAARRDVGAVGATLIYPDNTVQHAGVIIGINGLADHAHKMQPLMLTEERRHPGYLQSQVSVRDYSAVTAACMMVPASVFEETGGFDELQVVGFNDTDLCLRIGEAGYKVLNDPYAVLYHFESATRSKSDQIEHPEDSRQFRATWRTLLSDGDPFYNPLLDLHGPDHKLGLAERVDGRIGRVRVRSVALAKAARGPAAGARVPDGGP